MPNPEIIDGFEYTYETITSYGPAFDRPTKVHGPLVNKKHKVGSRDNSVPPLCFPAVANIPAGYDRGHIIGLGLGGPEHPKNLVPMLSFFNRVDYKGVENLLKAELFKHQTVYVGVVIDYLSNTPWMPLKFTILRHHGDPTHPEEPIVLDHYTRPRQPYTIPEDIYKCIKAHEAEFRGKFGIPNGQPLPYIFFERGLGYGAEVGVETQSDFAAGKFGKRQRECVWSLNCYNSNGGAKSGWLVSDVNDDSHRQLNPAGCLDFPEVDHITPFSRNGTNSFFNAQLTSAIYNRTKSAQANTGGDAAIGRSQPDRAKKAKFGQ
ncbi:MAG TPA: DNA/RNA non-specific endonuclease [Bryobacteraceae bacterium]|nr:DNA/RNA non-specific endonuclease [Bryobacteraceae bacterium]